MVCELHVMAVRCISSIPRLHKYLKFRWGRGGHFLPKGASRSGLMWIGSQNDNSPRHASGAVESSGSPELSLGGCLQSQCTCSKTKAPMGRGRGSRDGVFAESGKRDYSRSLLSEPDVK